jgi:predicted O-methyltransferase YrrM
MQRFFEKLSNVSPAKIGDWISNPWRIPLALNPPNVHVKSVDAATAFLPDLTQQQARALRLEFLRDEAFFAKINEAMIARRERHALFLPWNEFLYILIRVLQPRIMFETGVFDGQSSAVILRALHENKKGTLVSVDLPATSTMYESTHRMPESMLPADCQPGWIIPDYLRDRHQLFLGDSKKLLPELFEKNPEVDIFMHDSMHTFEYMYFEYKLAWPHLTNQGVLLSDDIFNNAAFFKFSKEHRRPDVCLGGFGAVRK